MLGVALSILIGISLKKKETKQILQQGLRVIKNYTITNVV